MENYKVNESIRWNVNELKWYSTKSNKWYDDMRLNEMIKPLFPGRCCQMLRIKLKHFLLKWWMPQSTGDGEINSSNGFGAIR